MSPKITWGDIGGAAPSAPSAPKPVQAEVVEESPKDLVEKADNYLNMAVDMIRKVDEIVGFFMQASGKGEVIEQAPSSVQGHLAAPSQAAAPPDQIMAVLDRILQAEGDIPLSKFAEALRKQEPWLIKYAMEATNETRPSGT